jgi:hypothetical protein
MSPAKASPPTTPMGTGWAGGRRRMRKSKRKKSPLLTGDFNTVEQH